jgi:starch phosphorylase
MTAVNTSAPATAQNRESMAKLLARDGSGPNPLAAADELYERHLLCDNVVDLESAGARERFEAIARTVRDILSHRWLRTEQAYAQANPKRVYYLSMEYLIGRSLANAVTNLLLEPLVEEVVKQENLDWLGLLEEEPDAGLGNGGLGRLAACFLDSMATLQLPAMGYGLRYEYGIFKQSIEDGWQRERPDHWLHHQDPWEVPRPRESVEVRLSCSFEVRGGTLRTIAGRPSTLIGIPFDRPVLGYGGKAINTLRLWAAAAPHDFDFQAFSHGEFVGALAEALTSESLTRVLYPDDSTSMGQGLRFVQEYFLVACLLADLVRRFRRDNADWNTFCEKVAIQLNDTHPALAVPELMRILLDEARLGWDEAWHVTQKALAYTNHTLLPEALEKWPLAWFELMLPRHLEIVLEVNRRFLDPRSAREMAACLVRAHAPSPPRDRPRGQSAVSRSGSSPLPRRGGPRRTGEPRRGGRRAQDPHGQPGHRRIA